MASISRIRSAALGTSNFEIISWYYFRLSGFLLVFLALGHMVLTHIVTRAEDVNYAFVVSRWSEPLWRLYDWLLLVLSLTHGANGMRIIFSDYVHNNGIRLLVMTMLWVVTIFMLIIGTQVIVAFEAVKPIHTTMR